MGFLTLLFTRRVSYIIIVVGVLIVCGYIYWRGKTDARQQIEVQVLRQDLYNRRQAEQIRDAIERLPDDAVFDGLREWVREGR